MRIFINGVAEDCPPGTLAELVARRELPSEALVVEVNHAIIGQDHWSSLQLKEDDRLELLSFVGGG